MNDLLNTIRTTKEKKKLVIKTHMDKIWTDEVCQALFDRIASGEISRKALADALKVNEGAVVSVMQRYAYRKWMELSLDKVKS